MSLWLYFYKLDPHFRPSKKTLEIQLGGGGGGSYALEIQVGGGVKEVWKSRWKGGVKKGRYPLGGVDFSGITHSSISIYKIIKIHCSWCNATLS